MAKEGGNPQNLKPFQPGQSGNPAGRPLSIASRLIELRPEIGEASMTRADAQRTLTGLLSLSLDQLQELADDRTAPALLSIAAKAMVESHKSAKFDVVSAALDRLFGRPTQPLSSDPDNPLPSAQPVTLVIPSMYMPPVTSEEEMERLMRNFNDGSHAVPNRHAGL